MPNYNEEYKIECEPVEDLFPEMITKEELLIEHGVLLTLKRILVREKYISDDLLCTILDVKRGASNE